MTNSFKPRGRLHTDEGVAAVEFALIAPLLMVILMGIIDYGYFFFINSTVVNAAREGARSGVVESTAGGATDAADSAANAYLEAAGVGTSAAPKLNTAVVTPTFIDAGETLQVVVAIDTFTPLTGFLPSGLLPSDVTYTSKMRWEMAE